MYKPAVTQILFVSKFSANTSNSWIFSLLPFTSLHCFPTYSVCAWPSQSHSKSLFSPVTWGSAYFQSLHSPLVFPSSFLFLHFFSFFSHFISLFLFFFLSLIINLVSRSLRFYNTEWQGWIGRHLVCHSLQTTEILKLPKHVVHSAKHMAKAPLSSLLPFVLVLPRMSPNR